MLILYYFDVISASCVCTETGTYTKVAGHRIEMEAKEVGSSSGGDDNTGEEKKKKKKNFFFFFFFSSPVLSSPPELDPTSFASISILCPATFVYVPVSVQTQLAEMTSK